MTPRILSAAEVAEVLARAEAASPAPWEYSHTSAAAGATQARVKVPWDLPWPPWQGQFDPENGGEVLAEFTSAVYCYATDDMDDLTIEEDTREVAERQFADLWFVANARTDVPLLAASHTAQAERIAALEGGLRRYGRHEAFCATCIGGRCTCGLAALLTPAPPAATASEAATTENLEVK